MFVHPKVSASHLPVVYNQKTTTTTKKLSKNVFNNNIYLMFVHPKVRASHLPVVYNQNNNNNNNQKAYKKYL